MMLKKETVGFVRGGSLYLEPPARWRSWQRDVWTCCQHRGADVTWLCRVCGGRTVYAGKPNFCPYCRASAVRLFAIQ